MTYDERLDAIREYLAKSDDIAVQIKGSIDGHNCRLDTALRELLVAEATLHNEDVEIVKRSDYTVRSVAVMVVLASMPGHPVLRGTLSQCAAEGIMRFVQFPDFLPRLHRAVHEEEALLSHLLRDAMEDE